MKRDEILQKAEQLINGDRAKDYGDAEHNFSRIATKPGNLLYSSNCQLTAAYLLFLFLPIYNNLIVRIRNTTNIIFHSCFFIW